MQCNAVQRNSMVCDISSRQVGSFIIVGGIIIFLGMDNASDPRPRTGTRCVEKCKRPDSMHSHTSLNTLQHRYPWNRRYRPPCRPILLPLPPSQTTEPITHCGSRLAVPLPPPPFLRTKTHNFRRQRRQFARVDRLGVLREEYVLLRHG